MITFKNIKNWFKKVYEYAKMDTFIVPILCIFFIVTIAYFYNINDNTENKNIETKESIFWKSNRDFNFIVIDKSIRNKNVVIKGSFINNTEGFNDKEVFLIFSYIDGINLNIGDTITTNTSYARLYENTDKFVVNNPLNVLKPDDGDFLNEFLTVLGILFFFGINIILICSGVHLIDLDKIKSFINNKFINGTNSIGFKLVNLGVGLILAFCIKSCQ